MTKAHQKTFLKTRAELIGCQPKVLAARTKRRLSTIRAQVDGIAAGFEDVDNYIVEQANLLLAEFDDFRTKVEDSVDWLNQSPD